MTLFVVTFYSFSPVPQTTVHGPEDPRISQVILTGTLNTNASPIDQGHFPVLRQSTVTAQLNEQSNFESPYEI